MMPQKKLVPFKIYFKRDQVFQIVTKNYFKMYQFKRWHLNVSNRSEIFQKTHVLVKIVVLKNFSIFTGKHLCWSLFLMKSHRPVTLLKERFQHMCFLVNMVKFSRTASFIEHLRWSLCLIKAGGSILQFYLKQI